LYTHRLIYDIFSNRGYHMLYTHILMYDISNRGDDVLYTHRLVYNILATGLTMFCIRTD